MQRILTFDIDKCTGYRSCEVSCSFFKEEECNPVRARIHVFSWGKECIDIPFCCVQCRKPACKSVHPVRAISLDEQTETLIIDHYLCIECRLCMLACPIGAISIDNVSRKMFKCDLCKGKPKCVENCQPKALEYALASTSNLNKMRKNAHKFVELAASG